MAPKCVQCGECCKEKVCEVGKVVFNTQTLPCPGLTFKEGKYWCNPVLMGHFAHKAASRIFKIGLGVGKGCSNENKFTPETIYL